jgi:hypothetical protein
MWATGNTLAGGGESDHFSRALRLVAATEPHRSLWPVALRRERPRGDLTLFC